MEELIIKTISAALSLAMIVGVSAPTFAENCTANPPYVQLTQTQVEALLGNGMACYPATGPFHDQMYHTGPATASSGDMIDYKKGPADPRDPSKRVGSYSISPDGVVSYIYAGGGIVTYTVWGSQTAGNGIYDFCSAKGPLQGHVRVMVGVGTPIPC